MLRNISISYVMSGIIVREAGQTLHLNLAAGGHMGPPIGIKIRKKGQSERK